MDIENQQNSAIYNHETTCTLNKSPILSKSSQQPSPRLFHALICHKTFLYIYGGLLLNPSQDLNKQHTFIYQFDIHKLLWKKIVTNFPSSTQKGASLQGIFGHCCANYGNLMYLFGGKNGKEGNCLNQLWTMNLDSFNWRRQDQKGIIPAKRQSASMILHNRSHFILYGGKNQDFIFNDFNIYKIQTKMWYSVDSTNYQFQLSKRIRPGICSLNDHIYIFGGQRQTSVQGESQILTDLYQLRIIYRTTSIKPDIWVRKVSSFKQPNKKISPHLLPFGERYFLMYGQGNSNLQNEGIMNKLWIFDTKLIQWNYINILNQDKIDTGIGFNCKYYVDKVFIFGGVSQTNEGYIPIKNLSTLNFDHKLQFSETEYNPRKICSQCQQVSKKLGYKEIQTYELFEACLKQITFPFSAFGLLIDNANMMKASQINISFNNGGQQRFALIQDNGSPQELWVNETDYLQDLLRFRTITESQMQIQDEAIHQPLVVSHPRFNNAQVDMSKQNKMKEQQKQEQRKLKIRKQQAKRNLNRLIRRRKQFSVNIKVGSMRLAKKMMHVSKVQYGWRIFIIQRVQNLKNSQKVIQYHCYNYSQQGEVPSNVLAGLVQAPYRPYIKMLQDIQHNSYKNFLFLIDLNDIINQQKGKQPELKIMNKICDVYFGLQKFISRAQACGIAVSDCIDISLRCYLSLLYLKGQTSKIILSTAHDKYVEITNSIYFQKIDAFVKGQLISDLYEAFDLQECKIVQLYHVTPSQGSQKSLSNQQITCIGKKDKINTFFNGILIYHKNRLIKRYKYPLGQLLKFQQIQKVTSKYYNPLKIFGFIQLDEVYYANILKFDFVNHECLQNMYSRIIFVQKYLQKNQYSPKPTMKGKSPSLMEEQSPSKKLKAN